MSGLETVVQVPEKDPHVPAASGALCRSISAEAVSRPEPASFPFARVIVTEPLVL